MGGGAKGEGGSARAAAREVAAGKRTRPSIFSTTLSAVARRDFSAEAMSAKVSSPLASCEASGCTKKVDGKRSMAPSAAAARGAKKE